jgi:hypothetical protein
MLCAALVAGTALAACGGSPTGSLTGSPSGSAGLKRADALAFARCMRTHGVPTFPDPSAGAGGLSIEAAGGPGHSGGPPQTLTINGTPVSAPAFRNAMTQCRGKLPDGGRPSAQQIARLRAGALAMARCMRSHGVPSFPDPNIQTGPGGGVGVRIGPGSGLDPSSPAFQTAQRQCMNKGPFGLKEPPPAGSSG